VPEATSSHAGGNFLLELNGVKCGFVKSVDGGAIRAQVIAEPGSSYYRKKHIGPLHYEELVLESGFAMHKSVYDWIAASWQSNLQRKDGAIVAADFNFEAKSKREFFSALISEVTIPACDGASKDPAFLSLRLAPEYIRIKQVDGKVSAEAGKAAQSMWVPSNFRLEISGLDCSKVTKVDSFTVKQRPKRDRAGEPGENPFAPGTIDFPDLRITVPENAAETWQHWFEDFVIDGNCTETHEKTGSLVFLSTNREKELASVSFFNLGIFRLAPEKPQPGAGQIRRIIAELYCERMEFNYGNNT
jgi:hypothetical protein